MAARKESIKESIAVMKGDKVQVEYTGKLDGGTVFDSSKGRAPLEFEVGANQVIPGFEKAVEGMKKGQKKTVRIEPEQAYGPYRQELVKKIPRGQLPQGQEPKAGMLLSVKLPNGINIPAKITEISQSEVTIDLNSPLAGKALTFEITLVGVNAE